MIELLRAGDYKPVKKAGRPKTNTVGRPKETNEEWLKGKSWANRAKFATELYYKQVGKILRKRNRLYDPIGDEDKALKLALTYIVDIYTIGHIEYDLFYDELKAIEIIHNDFIREITGEYIKNIL